MTDESKSVPQNPSEIDIIKELATLDPLDDRAFKILVSDDEQFKTLAESFSSEVLDDEKIIHMNGEIVLTVNGRLIRVDSLRNTTTAYINMDGQIIAEKFPFKRHVFYSALIYANGIQKGDDWEKLKPVISIVVYKDKGEAALFEKATLSGSLVKTDDDGKLLTLIAVNTAKWKTAPTEELRAYLSTLHHGIMTEDNKADFANVDVTGDAFAKIQRAVKIACAHTKKQEYENEGDDSMTAVLGQYITKEEKEAAEARGEARAFSIVSEVISSLKANVPVSEIASRYKIAIQEVEKLRTAL